MQESLTASEAYQAAKSLRITKKVGILSAYEYQYAAEDSSCLTMTASMIIQHVQPKIGFLI